MVIDIYSIVYLGNITFQVIIDLGFRVFFKSLDSFEPSLFRIYEHTDCGIFCVFIYVVQSQLLTFVNGG